MSYDDNLVEEGTREHQRFKRALSHTTEGKDFYRDVEAPPFARRYEKDIGGEDTMSEYTTDEEQPFHPLKAPGVTRQREVVNPEPPSSIQFPVKTSEAPYTKVTDALQKDMNRRLEEENEIIFVCPKCQKEINVKHESGVARVVKHVKKHAEEREEEEAGKKQDWMMFQPGQPYDFNRGMESYIDEYQQATNPSRMGMGGQSYEETGVKNDNTYNDAERAIRGIDKATGELNKGATEAALLTLNDTIEVVEDMVRVERDPAIAGNVKKLYDNLNKALKLIGGDTDEEPEEKVPQPTDRDIETKMHSNDLPKFEEERGPSIAPPEGPEEPEPTPQAQPEPHTPEPSEGQALKYLQESLDLLDSILSYLEGT